MAVTPEGRRTDRSGVDRRVLEGVASVDPVVLRGPAPSPGPGGERLITSFTSICPLRAEVGAHAVRELLERLPVGPNSPFAVDGTHYARLQVIDEVVGRRRRRRPLAAALLVLSADVDGTAERWLDELLREQPVTFANVLSQCAGGPGDPTAPDFVDRAAAHLLRHRVPVSLHYVNDPGRTVGEVRLAVERHRRLAGFALGHRSSTPATRRAAFLAAFTRPEPRHPAAGDASDESGREVHR